MVMYNTGHHKVSKTLCGLSYTMETVDYFSIRAIKLRRYVLETKLA